MKIHFSSKIVCSLYLKRCYLIAKFIVISSQTECFVNSTLEDGDCGSIVHIKKRKSNKWQPLAMFVSRMQLDTTTSGFSEPRYEAVLLHQAFRDMEQEYPHRVSNIRRFRFQ